MTYRYCKVKGDCYDVDSKMFDDGVEHKDDCECRTNKTGVYVKCMPCDLPEYISPITGKPVDGRTARREELKRSGCREVDPSEFKVEYKNQRFIEKHGIRQ